MKKAPLFLLILWACGGPDGAREGGFGTQGQDGATDAIAGGSGGTMMAQGGKPALPANSGGSAGAGAMPGNAGAGGALGGAGGISSSGGAPATGGMGGSVGSGGATGSGGMTGTGGIPASGGKSGTGGASATGGASGSGGAPSSGKPNLLMNPGFESGESMWQRFGGTGAIASPGRTGNNRLDEPSSYPWWKQDVSGFIAGRTYRVAAWGKCGTPGGRVGIKGGLSTGGDQREESPPFSTAWSEQSFVIALQNEVGWAQVFLSGSGENCSFDDVSMVEQ